MTEDKIKEFIKKINARCADGSYIFRGTREIHKDTETEYGISSTLYRKYKDPRKRWTSEFGPANTEKEIVNRLKNRQKDYEGYTNIEILTDLRHHGGKVALIDFSLNVYVSLFFACNGKFKKDGELTMLERSEIPHIDEVKYENPIFSVINPAPTKDGHKRAMSQNSVFVYAPSGFIARDMDIIKIEVINCDDKKDILAYLEKHYNISQNSIYNDLQGFIDNEENYASSRDKFDEGHLYFQNEKFDKAIELNEEAIILDPNFAEAYVSIGNMKNIKENYKEASESYTKAIEKNRNFAEAYRGRGLSMYYMERHKEAIDDWKESMVLNTTYASTLRNYIALAEKGMSNPAYGKK